MALLYPKEGKFLSAVEACARCDKCNGTGKVPGNFIVKKRVCKSCFGSGVAKGWVSMEFFAKELMVVMDEIKSKELEKECL